MDSDTREGMILGFISSAAIAAVIIIPIYLAGHVWPATVVGCVYMALWAVPLITVPICYWVASKVREAMRFSRAVKEAQSNATVEEIDLKHQLEMEKIRLEQYRLQHELKKMYIEDGVEIPDATRSVRRRG